MNLTQPPAGAFPDFSRRPFGAGTNITEGVPPKNPGMAIQDVLGVNTKQLEELHQRLIELRARIIRPRPVPVENVVSVGNTPITLAEIVDEQNGMLDRIINVVNDIQNAL